MKTKFIPYKDQDTELEGFSAYESESSEAPGVILCHAWAGRDDFVCEKAKEIAQWGYSTFALDLYGNGVLGRNKEENLNLMTPFITDRNFLQRRLLLALETFQKQSVVNSKKICVLGFCFGGLCALDFARSGADIRGAISIHGLLAAPENTKTQMLKSKVLVLHGYNDPMVPPEEVLAFSQEMTKTATDWQMHIFGNTMHAFTNPIANDPNFGTVYNPVANKRTWILVRDFLSECFA